MSLRGPGSRRDAKLKGGNVIKGFRLDSSAARELIAYAREHFCRDSGHCDLAAAARFILRTQLGWAVSSAGDNEKLEAPTRGMRMEYRLVAGLKHKATTTGLGFVPTVRHLLRIGLGLSEEESLRREMRFAEIAEARREIMGAG